MSQPLMGAPRSRVEGPQKTSGKTKYTGDYTLPGLAHAVIVPSAIAKGRISHIDDSRVRRLPGVLAVITHRNAPSVNAKKTSEMDSLLFLLQNDVVEFDRQPIAVIVAETFEQAVYAADHLRVVYERQTPVTALLEGEVFTPKEIFGEPANRERGNPEHALSSADVNVDQHYHTPTEHHNPMETHGTIAHWEGDRLVVYDSTQWAFGVRKRLGAVFGLDPKNIHVEASYVGGAFGSKGQPWSHVPLCAMAAKVTKRPVKLLVTRPQMFGWVGHRPQTEQHVALGADRGGALVAVRHNVISETSISDEFVEPSAVFSRDLYRVQNYAMSHELRRLNISKPTYQRGPGESTGSFAMESAMDELAYALHLDPLELRYRNYSLDDPDSGKSYTSKHLRECYRMASERFGWEKRDARVGSMRNGRMLVGYGMATASRATHRSAASTRIHMSASGDVTLSSGTIEQGTGTPTVYAQLAAEILEIPFERVTFEFGNTALPEAPIAAGSQTAGTIGSVVVLASTTLRERLRQLNGKVPVEGITLDVHDKPSEAEEKDYASQAFGAHFAEVEVDPDVATIRVTRFVGAFDAGRILNEKTARSQLIGGIVWGISMALHEQTRFDTRSGRIMNATLSQYLIPTHADIPEIEALMVEEDDEHGNPAHVKGIGEVGICGAAAAVANAVYHATGVRLRSLPITPASLIALLPAPDVSTARS